VNLPFMAVRSELSDWMSPNPLSFSYLFHNLGNVNMAFYATRPSAHLEATLRARIAQNSVPASDGCIRWEGAKCERGYGRMKFTTEEGFVRYVRPHRLVYFLTSGRACLQRSMHVSHLCNVKDCVQPAHLSYEENFVNQQRKNCFSEDRCTGHQEYPRCLTKY